MKRGPGPEFIIIGAMKCATSTLHVQLAEQSGIFMTEPKEPNFFSNDEIWSRGLDWYEALFAGAGEDDLCGESSTHYTKLPTYPDTVWRIAENVDVATKFIYVIRHPIDRLVSHYIHEWSEGVISVPIDTAIDKHPELISYSCYAEQLEPFIKTFGRERVLPIFFDRLISHPQEELERTCAFIGCGKKPVWNFDIVEQNVSSKRSRPTLMLKLLMNIPGSKHFRRTFIPPSVREKIKRLWRMNERPLLTDERILELTKTFDQDLARLGGWLGVDINCGNFKSSAREFAPSWRTD